MKPRDPYFTPGERESALTLLSREDERRLRAQAWRHIRRINAKVAREIWARHRYRELREAA